MFLRQNVNGDFIGTIEVRAKIMLNATCDGYTNSAKLDFFDAQGKLVRSVDVTAHGTRMKVESP